jgi:hypothetical protein
MQRSFSLYSEASLSGLFHSLTDDAKIFVRQEVELAKREMTEKVSRYGRHATILGIGGMVTYAGLIVFLGGLGWLLAFWMKNLGLEPMLANFVGFGAIGLLVMLVGASMVFKAIKAFSSESLTPTRIVETIEHLKGKKPITRTSLKKETKTESSLRELEGKVFATEDRIEMELKEIGYRVRPNRIKVDTIEHLLRYASPWGVLAFGSGLVGSFLLNHKPRHGKA